MNKITAETEFLIIGLGVIGGSYAEALSRKGYKVKAITKEQKDIDYALQKKMISEGTTEIDKDMIKNADIIVFALYPHILIEWLEKNQQYISPGTLITDVTGVKSAVVPKVQSLLRPDLEFIASHPMAGRESRGIEYADGNIFKSANFIVTPTEKNTREATEICKQLGEILGFSRISELSLEENDRLSFTAHPLHCNFPYDLQHKRRPCQIYGRLFQRPYPYRKNQRRNVVGTVSSEQKISFGRNRYVHKRTRKNQKISRRGRQRKSAGYDEAFNQEKNSIR